MSFVFDASMSDVATRCVYIHCHVNGLTAMASGGDNTAILAVTNFTNN